MSEQGNPFVKQSPPPPKTALQDFFNQADTDAFQAAHPVPLMRGPADASAPSPSSSPNNGPGLASDIGNAIEGIGAGALRAPGQAVGGLLDFGADAGRFIGNSMVPIVRRYPAVAKAFVDTTNAFNNSTIGSEYNRLFNPNLDGHTDFANRLSLRDSLGQAGSKGWNQGSAELLSLAVGYGLAARAAKGVGLAGAANTALDTITSPGAKFAAKLAMHSAGLGATAGVFMDPEEERLSNGLQALGVHNQFLDWLGNHDPKQEGHFEDRFKTALDTAIGNVPAELMFDTARYWIKGIKTGRADAAMAATIKSRMDDIAKQAAGHADFNPEAAPTITTQATPEQAAQQHLDDAFAQVRTRMLMGGQPVPRTFFGMAGDPNAIAPIPGAQLAGDVTPELRDRMAAIADQSPPSEAVPTSSEPPATPTPHQPFGQRPPVTPQLRDRMQAVSGVEQPPLAPVTLTQGEAARPFGLRPSNAPGALTRDGRAAPVPGANTAQEPGFTTTPGAIAAEHAAEVSSLEAQGAKAAADKPKGGQLPNDFDPRTQIASDANVALEHAGATDRLDAANLPLQADGKLAISPDGKAAADGAGYGKAFVSNADTPPPADTVLLAGTKDPGAGSTLNKVLDLAGAFLRHSGGAARVFGRSTKEDLIKFNQEASAWRDAVRKGGPDVADIAPGSTDFNRVGQWKMGNLGAEADVPGYLRALTAYVTPAVKKLSDMEVQRAAYAAANAIGEDPTAVLEYARQISGRLGDAAQGMATLRTVWTRAAKDLGDVGIGSSKDWTQATDAEAQTAIRKIYNMAALSSEVQKAKAGLGRGLRVNQLPDADAYAAAFAQDPDGAALPRPLTGKDVGTVGPLPRNKAELQDWSELWGMAKGDPQLQSKFLANSLTVPPPGLYARRAIWGAFTASVLSAPKTIGLNVIGPAILGTLHTLEKTAGAAFASFNPLASAAERADMRATASAAAMAHLQTLGDMRTALYYAGKAATENHPVLGGGGSGVNSAIVYGPLTENLLKAAGQEADWRYAFGNLINVWPKAFARVNNGLDELSKRLSYMGEIRTNALVAGSRQGLSGPALNDFVQQALASSVDEAGHATDDYMERVAEGTTLTAQVGEAGTKTRMFGNFVQRLRNDIPEIRSVLTVFNVSANALGETLRRTPLAIMPLTRSLFQKTSDELAGLHGPVAQAEAWGRQLTGAAFLTGGYLLNRAGLITGAGPQEHQARQIWLLTHQPYSIRVGGKWVSYNKYDIVGGLLSIPATIHDATTYYKNDKGWGDLMASGVGALSQWFEDKAALQTAAQLLTIGSDPTQSIPNQAGKLFGNTVAGFFPRAITTTVREPMDPVIRLKNGWQDYLKDAVPGWSQTLEPATNIFGEPIARPNDSIGEAMFPVTIAPAVSYAQDPQSDEMDRLYQATGDAAGSFPRSLSYGAFNPRDVQLEDGKSLYTHAMLARATTQVDGQTLREALGQLFDSDEYNRAVDADSNQSITSLGDKSRGYLVKQVFDKYEKQIKADLANSSPLALAYLTAAAAKQKDDAYLSKYSADDLVKNPLLYDAAGVDAAAYSRKIQGSGGLLNALQGTH